MYIIEAGSQMRDEIIALLQSQKLPVEDLPLTLTDFYVAKEAGKIIGIIGMERFGQFGLLRSMVVHPDYRNQQIAAILVHFLEQLAAGSGIKSMYLLTETAAGYFSKKGYLAINRDQAPAEIKKSSEFSHVCPVSAIVMAKEIKIQ